MKRNYNTSNNYTLRSKTISNPIININYISPTKIKNYLMNDPLCDYLKEYQISNQDNPNNINPMKKNKSLNNYENIDISLISNTTISNKDVSFFKFITEQGNKFEELIYNYLSTKYNTVKIVNSYEDVHKYSKVTDTIYNINIQTPIIFQALLSSDKLQYFGCIDFLVRSDIFYELFIDILPEYKIKKNSIQYLYEVIDVKHSTLKLSSNGYNVLNTDRYPAYKGQLYIYLALLNEVQQSNLTQAYLFGKAYHYSKSSKIHKGEALFKKLGVVDFKDYDSIYKTRVNDAVKWIYNMRNNGDKWQLVPKPSTKELYPNMKNKGTKWDGFKIRLAQEIGEITSIYYCGVKKRINCHTKQIYSWHSKDCNAKTLGFNPNNKTGQIIDSILNINRTNSHDSTRNKIDIGTLTLKQLVPDNTTLNLFVDYETVNADYGQCHYFLDDDNNLSKNYNYNNNFTFMIGIGYKCKDTNEWIYKCFYLPNLDNNLELQMFKDVESYITDTCNKYNYKKHRLIHWTSAEISFTNKFKSKWTPRPKLNFKWFDLFTLLKNNIVTVKGCFDYSLKSFGNAMNNNGMIALKWDTDNCSNGIDCMLQAIELYKSNSVNNDNTDFKHIITYNEIDCKIMFLIYEYLCNILEV